MHRPLPLWCTAGPPQPWHLCAPLIRHSPRPRCSQRPHLPNVWHAPVACLLGPPTPTPHPHPTLYSAKPCLSRHPPCLAPSSTCEASLPSAHPHSTTAPAPIHQPLLPSRLSDSICLVAHFCVRTAPCGCPHAARVHPYCPHTWQRCQPHSSQANPTQFPRALPSPSIS